MKDLFDEIDEQRQDLPKLKKISNEVQKKRNYNFYQQLAVCLFIFLFILSYFHLLYSYFLHLFFIFNFT